MTASFRTAAIAAILSLVSLHALPANAGAEEAEASSQAAQRGIGESTNAALQGDSKRSLAALRAVPAEQFAGKDADYRACMLDRFGRASPPLLAPTAEEPFLGELLTIYQSYWWHALSAPSKREALDAKLRQRLHRLLGQRGNGGDWVARRRFAN